MAADVNPSVNNWHSLTPYHDDPSIPSYSNFKTDDESVPDIKHLYISADCPTLIMFLTDLKLAIVSIIFLKKT